MRFVSGGLALFSMLVAGGCLDTSAAEGLISPPAPFAKKKEAPAEEESAAAVFTPDGIVCGNKALRWSAMRPLELTLDEDTLVSFQCRVQTTFSDWLPIEKFKIETDEKTRTMTGRAEFPLNKSGAKGEFTQTVRLLDDGRAEMTLAYSCPKDAASDFKVFISDIAIPKRAALGQSIESDGQVYEYPDDTKWGSEEKLWVHMGCFYKTSGFVFRPKSPETGFSVGLAEKASVGVFRSRSDAILKLDGDFRKPDGQLKMFVDFRRALKTAAAEDSVAAGINFTKCDNWTVPFFKGSKNMLMNPSFESGTRYFMSGRPHFECLDRMLTDKDTKFGRKSLLLQKDTGTGITLMPVPVSANKPYVFSFYAKSSDGEKHSAGISMASYGNIRQSKSFQVSGKDWTRQTFSFNIPTSIIKLSLNGENTLIDGLQLEEGETPSEYCGNQIGMEIVTDSPDGMVADAGQKFNARLVIRGPEGVSGAVSVKAGDLYYRELFNRKFSFKIPASGEQSFPLDIDGGLPLGSFTVRADITPDNLPSYTDIFRLTRFKYMKGVHKSRNIQSSARYGYNITFDRVPDSDLALMEKIGTGQLTYYSMAPLAKKDCERLKKFGIEMTNVELLSTHGGGGWKTKLAWQPLTWDSLPLTSVEKSSPELEANLEELCFEAAKKYPYINVWMLPGEPETRFQMLLKHNYEDYARVLHACYNGVKRGNPNAVVMGNGGPCNMGREGMKSLEDILSACNKLFPDMRFEASAIHPYRMYPEEPDLETDTLKFFAMLKEQGYGDKHPVYFNEGAYYYPLNVPAWSVAPGISCQFLDAFGHMLSPSYDMGWAERVSAAMVLRHWLVCFKYMDRIKGSTPWMPLLIDSRTPFAWAAMSSALADILGDSVFKKDIRFAPGARAYVFEDGKKRPAAAVWRWTEALDRGRENASGMTVNMKNVTPEFIDMLGNICDAPHEGDVYTLPLSSYPFYIRAKEGELDALCAALQTACLSNSNSLPLDFSAKLETAESAVVKISNPLTKPFSGSVTLNGGPSEPLKLNSMEQISLPVKLKDAVPFDKIAAVSIPADVKTDGGKDIKTIFQLNAFAVKHVSPGAITVDGKTDDWKDIPAIKIENLHYEEWAKVAGIKHGGPEDFSASYRMAWNKNALYMLIEVTDNDFVMNHKNQNPASWYDNDAVQIFIDPFDDAKAKALRGSLGYDDNDFSYELLPTGDNSAVVYRRLAPDQQLTGGLSGLKENVLEPDVKTAFRHEGNKQIYEVEFPARYLMPLPLEAGTSAGIAFAVFDRDGADKGAKQILTNTPKDAAFPFRRPDVYPSMLLTK